MSKTSIKEWIYTAHMPPEVLADFERLFQFPSDIRSHVLIAGQSDRQILDQVADELSAILEGKD